MTNPQLQHIVSEFAARIGCGGLEAQGDGMWRFVCDGRFVVSIASEPDTGRAMLFALAGFAPGHADERMPEDGLDTDAWDDVAGPDDAAEEAHVEDDDQDFALRLRFHEDTGAVAVQSAAAPHSLDAVAFSAWVERFLDRLTETAAYLASAADGQSVDSADDDLAAVPAWADAAGLRKA